MLRMLKNVFSKKSQTNELERPLLEKKDDYELTEILVEQKSSAPQNIDISRLITVDAWKPVFACLDVDDLEKLVAVMPTIANQIFDAHDFKLLEDTARGRSQLRELTSAISHVDFLVESRINSLREWDGKKTIFARIGAPLPGIIFVATSIPFFLHTTLLKDKISDHDPTLDLAGGFIVMAGAFSFLFLLEGWPRHESDFQRYHKTISLQFTGESNEELQHAIAKLLSENRDDLRKLSTARVLKTLTSMKKSELDLFERKLEPLVHLRKKLLSKVEESTLKTSAATQTLFQPSTEEIKLIQAFEDVNATCESLDLSPIFLFLQQWLKTAKDYVKKLSGLQKPILTVSETKEEQDGRMGLVDFASKLLSSFKEVIILQASEKSDDDILGNLIKMLATLKDHPDCPKLLEKQADTLFTSMNQKISRTLEFKQKS